MAAPHAEAFLDHLEIAGQEHHGPQGGARVASGIVVAEIAEADYVGGAGVADVIVLQLFGFGYGILGPTQVDASEVGFLGGESDGRFLGLVENLHVGFGIDLGRERVDVHGGEESGRFYYAMPAKGIDPVGIRGNADRIGSVVIARLEGGYGSAMLVVAQSPVREHGEQREGRGQSSGWRRV